MKKHNGFTLLEILVVVTIMALGTLLSMAKVNTSNQKLIQDKLSSNMSYGLSALDGVYFSLCDSDDAKPVIDTAYLIDNDFVKHPNSITNPLDGSNLQFEIDWDYPVKVRVSASTPSTEIATAIVKRTGLGSVAEGGVPGSETHTAVVERLPKYFDELRNLDRAAVNRYLGEEPSKCNFY